jgi:hypothetical protein
MSSSSKNKKTSGNSAGAGAAIVAVLGIGMFVTFKALKVSAKAYRTGLKHVDSFPEGGIRYFDDVNPNTLKREHTAKTPNPIPWKITETVVDMAKGEHDEPVIYPEESDRSEPATAGLLPKSNQAGSTSTKYDRPLIDIDYFNTEKRHSPWTIEPFTEMKTIWHPSGA